LWKNNIELLEGSVVQKSRKSERSIPESFAEKNRIRMGAIKSKSKGWNLIAGTALVVSMAAAGISCR
jgi:hypothetical protein